MPNLFGPPRAAGRKSWRTKNFFVHTLFTTFGINLADIEMKKEKKSKLNRELRLAILHEHTYEQVFSLKLTPLTVFTVVGSIGIILVAGVTMLIAFTGLREYIPGYPTGEERRMIIRNQQRADSLLAEMEVRDKMLTYIRSVLSDDIPDWALNRDTIRSKATDAQAISFERSEADSLFRLEIERNEQFNVAGDYGTGEHRLLEMTYFFPPLRGIVTNTFGYDSRHYAIDIVAAEGAHVCTILDGTVILACWTAETGYLLAVQHDNQLVSIYKHCGQLLKNVGQHVTVGEVVATVGNSGELTTGPHLHFEMWHNGVPVNPENYISFE